MPTSTMAAVVSRREIEQALEHEQFALLFQPIIDLATGQPRGAEALIRWRHPERGLLTPDAFLPAVAQTPVMSSITRWVLDTACAAAAPWPQWTISVNITARDLAGASLVEDVLAALESAGLPPSHLVLELTETALVQDLPRAAEVLNQLREHGIGVALDDFGTGYSSMLYLRELPVTSVKIDRIFMAGLDRDSDDLAIVTSLLTLVRAVGLTAVAEGVETDVQAQVLHSLGCHFGQGYLWSRPLSQDDAAGLHGDAPRVRGKKASRGAWAEPPDERLGARAHELLVRGASLHTIAAALNADGERTHRGSRWSPATVARLINTTHPRM
jgi:EAL domain-containing protein (putative c-di-GMP-specific phosphodiesterase class I)